MDKNWVKNTVNIELELTSQCEVNCIACARNINGFVNKHFDQWEKLIRNDLNAINLQGITFTSNWGDPLDHPKFLEILELLLECYPDIKVQITSSLHYGNEDFYYKLASILTQFQDAKIITNIYGTGDLHCIFRRNSDFEKVKVATTILAKNNTKVYWKFPIFKFNREDVDNIYDEAEACGVCNLEAISFSNNSKYNHLINQTDGKADSLWLLPPEDPEYDFVENWGNHGFVQLTRNKKFDGNCESMYRKSVWIDPWGGVWPCYGLGKFSMENEDLDGVVIDDAIDKYGFFNNLSEYSIIEILNHEWYTTILPSSQDTMPWQACKKECDI